MKPRIVDSDSAIGEAQILKLERALGFALPEEYRVFLIQNNGGRAHPDAVPTPSFPGSAASSLKVFYGIGTAIQSEDLLRRYGVWIEDCPRHLLPIACDDGGSQYCLSLSGSDRGCVYYWDYYREAHSVKTKYPFTYLLAKSFEEFLESFRDILPEDMAPKS